MVRHVIDGLTVKEDRAVVADALEVLSAGLDHGLARQCAAAGMISGSSPPRKRTAEIASAGAVEPMLLFALVPNVKPTQIVTEG
jgi:hypothetical protein